MRHFWNDVNRVRRERVHAEVAAAKVRQAQVSAFWDRHKTVVKERWAGRTAGRGKTMIVDIPEIAVQWHSDNTVRPEEVSATAQQRGVAVSPYLWECPLGLGHKPWPAWPKDRVQAGAGCPACRQLIRLADLRTLADQYRGLIPAGDTSFAARDRAPWVCRTWAVEPTTGRWHKVEHHFDAVTKERALQGDGCRVCAGYVIDDTNSLQTWFPEIAAEVDDPDIDPRQLSTSQHNISRKKLDTNDPKDAYERLSWRCRHGHRWKATILNRVRGARCPRCSTAGTSKEQVRLIAELAGLMDYVPPQPRDARLPDGLTDFASHQITVPPLHKPDHWRYKAVEVDAVFHVQGGLRIGVEYDGSYHHSVKKRDRQQFESEKSQVLAAADKLDLLVHVRVGDLPPLEAPQALSVPIPERSDPYQQACAVATAIRNRIPDSVPGLDDYVARRRAQCQEQADAYILAVWGELRPPRRKPERVASPRPRRLKETEPHHDSLLTPVDAPYRNPVRSAEIVRDYQCACGNSPFTAVQAQVTSGNTKSCGCLRNQTKQQQRSTISSVETRDARAWAREQGIEVGVNGRVPDRITASYRLSKAGRLDALGSDGLLEEHRVQQWAQLNGQKLGARGRVTSEVWLAYAIDCLTVGEPDDGATEQQPAREAVQEGA
ncbi:zinc-ribbon domain-containing protein [Streptomyces sp. NBC_00328]|uniref:zinc-ribbon domain-containing protein n=1 Tax=Streptomyces sp. NBC_00328 TaxID=2903646 RepID=UPI002E28DBE0|nr:zinc-ribbon domain-containing protein [Streptomyces sp. NBC_00328]